jgi:hypothetical protein
MSDMDFGDNNDNEFFLDLSDAEDTSNSFKPLPAGKYTVIINKVEQKKTKAGDSALNVTMSVEGMNRKLFDYIMLTHANPDVVKIGRGRAKAMFLAGFGKPTGNFLELAGKVVQVKIAIDKKDDTKNTIQDYSAAPESRDADIAF